MRNSRSLRYEVLLSRSYGTTKIRNKETPNSNKRTLRLVLVPINLRSCLVLF